MVFFHQIPNLWYYFVIPEIHGICHQFPIAWENAAQPILLEKNKTLTLILSHVMGPSVSSNLHPMVCNTLWFGHGCFHEFSVAWVNLAKRVYHMGRTWNIYTHTLLKIRIISLPPDFLLMGY